MMDYKKWQKGGLREDGKPGFDTPSGKFEIWSTVLEDYGYEPLPKYVEPKEGPVGSPELAQEFPLVFNSGARPHTDFRSQHHGIKGLAKDKPEPTVDLNLADAAERDIQTGDLVEVCTPRGAVSFRARVTDDILQGAIEANMGGGTPVRPKAWREWNVNELTDLSNYDDVTGFPVYKSLLCEVVKIEEGTDATRRAAGKRKRSRLAQVAEPLKVAQKPKHRIYLDNNATTKMADAVRDAMLPYLESEHGNPSSIHATGREAKEAVETARRQVAKLINAAPRRIVLTGGGSEADNLALKGISFAHRDRGNHIITTTVEHPAILNTCKFLEGLDYEVTYLEVDQDGWLAPDKLREVMRDDTILVSVMMANNEVGTIMPIKELCHIAHERGALFHTDAVQAVGKIKVDVKDLDVDLLSLSGHKLHGPKGVGTLYVKKGVKLEPLIHGGEQEAGLRAGTENVPAIVGLGKAAELAVIRKAEEIGSLRDQLQMAVQQLVPEAELNGRADHRLPNTLNMTLPELRGESLVVAMDQHGISLSSGSACKSGSPDPTHVLMAMGRTEVQADCAIRFSLSRDTTEQDIEDTATALEEVLEEMETTVRFLPCK